MRGLMRRLGARALLCLVIGALLTLPRRVHAQELAPLVLTESETEPGVVVYRSTAPGPRPISVVLHGMCGEPERACAHFARAIGERGEHLVCPRARVRCAGGGSTWPNERATADVEAAVQRALSALAGQVDESAGRTLIGYSLGAFRALEIAESARGRYPRLMLIGAKVYPNQRLLLENGVLRVLLAAGDWDMMNQHMQRQTQLLLRARCTARFLGLGPAGHAFSATFADLLPLALDWLHAQQ